MPSLEKIINDTIEIEGGYVDHPNDPGGRTKYGITERTARANGYEGDMKDLPRDVAFGIYFSVYIVQPGFDLIGSDAIRAEVFDTGVNMGQMTSAKFLQRAINAVSGAGLVVDGHFGPRSQRACAEYLASRKNAESILLKALNCLQGARYIELVEANSKNRSFINGWIANRVEI